MPETRAERPLCRNHHGPTGGQHAAILLFLLLGISSLWFLFATRPYPSLQPPTDTGQHPSSASAATVEPPTTADAEQLIDLLKEKSFWQIDARTEIPPPLVEHFPEGMDRLSVDQKKRLFLHTLLPAAITALNEVEGERQLFLTLISRIPNELATRGLTCEDREWQGHFTADEIRFLTGLTIKYRTTNIDKLAMRIDGLPPSLLLAQGAIESSWGTSRFARQGNNIFGLWTWGENGMIPQERGEGDSHKVATYDSILESVRKYLLTINRHPAYQQLRETRFYTMDPYALAQGLTQYSERGLGYVEDIRQIIDRNNLSFYDRLAATPVKASQFSKPPTDEITSI
ncbi:MAG: glucosaminidase domain-containing protein [Thermodesulfobacteriota bacterium]